jgi:hypothetical protein
VLSARSFKARLPALAVTALAFARPALATGKFQINPLLPFRRTRAIRPRRLTPLHRQICAGAVLRRSTRRLLWKRICECISAGETPTMSTSSAVEVVAWPHTLKAARDEARLIQDSLLPSGTLRGDAFEIAFRFAPLAEVVEISLIFSLCPTVWWACTGETSSARG